MPLRRRLAVWVVAGTLALTASEASLLRRASAAELRGPGSVHGQIEKDEEARAQPGPALPRIPLRERLAQERGLVLGADYNALYQYATEQPGPNGAAGGVARIYAHWTPLRRGTKGAGTLVFKGEQRHRLGTEIAPKALGPGAGYAGLSAIPFSDAGAVLTNLYWIQALFDNRLEFIAGTVDVTDYVDVYSLVNPWTDFNNLAFSNNPTIPAPNQGLGAAARWTIARNVYILGGVADANGDPHHPIDGFETFFSDREYFSHVELGWFGSWEKRFADNVHVTAWYADSRAEAGVDSGWGLALSFSRIFAEHWTPFLRGGFSDGGGALVDRSISTGVGYRLNDRGDTLALGANWSRPPTSATGGRHADQYTFEAYCRLHLLPQVAVTPDVQYVVDPALDPDGDDLWILGIRVRAVF